MALQVTDLKRVFKFNGEELPDPDPNYSTDEVIGYYSVKYPELTTATVAGPNINGEVAEYEFKTTVGTKG
jgi:PRTRC genetic system protein C